jgi:MbtH protein
MAGKFVLGVFEMTNPFDDEDHEFLVLVNQELQYSLWPVFREPPSGWRPIGPRGKRQVCLDWIEATWKDMRPKRLADAMDGYQRKSVLSSRDPD